MSDELINVFQQYLDDDGDVLVGGQLFFFVNGTTTLTTVFSDSALTIPQDNPYTLDASGRVVGDVHYSTTITIEVRDSSGAFIRSLDDQVALSPAESAALADLTQIQQEGVLDFDLLLTYRLGVIVVDATDDNYYKSRINGNIGNVPNANPTEWLLVPQTYGDVFSTELVNNDTSTSIVLAPTAAIIRALGIEIDTNATDITTIENNVATQTQLEDGTGAAHVIASLFSDIVATSLTTTGVTLNANTASTESGSYKIGGLIFNFGRVTYSADTQNTSGTINLADSASSWQTIPDATKYLFGGNPFCNTTLTNSKLTEDATAGTSTTAISFETEGNSNTCSGFTFWQVAWS